MGCCSKSKFFLAFRENWKDFWSFTSSSFCLGFCDPEKSCEMNAVMIGEGEERPIVPVSTQTDARGEDGGNDCEQLLPGILNDITVNHIIPRLLLSLVSPVLSLVSGGWRRAIHSEEVYHASARFHSTETLVALNPNPHGEINRIALYSPRDRTRYSLPPVPGFGSEFPASCKCISLNRKLYLIGGEGDLYSGGGRVEVDAEMYVLDMAGSSLEWEVCAGMEDPRKDFGCAVKDGKIYVFGGSSGGYWNNTDVVMSESEVYDPQENCWFSIAPMKTGRSGHEVARVGEELVVYGGHAYNADEEDDGEDGGEGEVHELEFYHPGRNEWRVVEPFGREGLYRMFLAEGKFYAMTLNGIFVHDDDIEKNSWREIHSFSLPTLPARPRHINFYGHGGHYDFDNSCPVLVVNGELLTISYLHHSVTGAFEPCIVQSKGFGSKNKELKWEKPECNKSLSFVMYQIDSPVLCPIIL